MSQRQSVITIEFNELCPNLMNRFIAEGELPRFKRFYEESEVFETDAEESGELLNPWVQWISVHTGLAASEHQVTTLSEGHKVGAAAVWDTLSSAGLRVWVCGSMNTRYDSPLKGYLLPDPWSTGTQSYPPGEFDGYLDYIRSAVQEHTAGGKGSMKSFLRYMLGHGLSLRTILSASRQVMSERLANTKWKRARIMDLFQWDLFRHYYKRLRPDFATFFLNSTAHYQHSYWRNMEPEKFQSRPSEAAQKDYSKAILFGYKHMDELIGRLMRLAGRNTTLIFCTALSQQPYLDHEEAGGRHYYRLRDKACLGKQLALPETFVYEPVMSDQFFLRFPCEKELAPAEAKLISYHVKHPGVFPDERTRAFHVQRKEGALMAQCRCTTSVPVEARITAADNPNVSIPFYDVFYQVDTVKSGRHHPAGMLWIRHPDRRQVIHTDKVSIRSIAPTILRLFSLPVSLHMREKPLDTTSCELSVSAGYN